MEILKNYEILSNGVIKQIIRQPFDYDFEYSNNYNKLGETGKRMSYLRLGYLLGVLKITPKSILDIGYGNGDFLEACTNIIPACYGYDLSPYPVPNNAIKINSLDIEVDVITMFDVLEHWDDIYDIKDLKCSYLYISLPNCDYKSNEWFINWKHRKPNEHLWFFNKNSLINFMKEVGFEYIDISYIEDVIRIDPINNPNILTAIFKKIK